MFEKVYQAIHHIKNSVSLKFINAQQRQKVFLFLSNIAENHNQGLATIDYIKEIQENHEGFMGTVSKFVDELTQNLSQYTLMYEELHQQHLQLKRQHFQQNTTNNLDLSQLLKRIEQINIQMIKKQQQIRQLHLKLQSRQAEIENIEKQSSQYFKKIQCDLTKQQNMLEESYLIVKRYQQQINELKIELQQTQYVQRMQNMKVELTNTNENHEVIRLQKSDRYSVIQIDRSASESSDQIKYSVISSFNSENNICQIFEETNSIEPLRSNHELQNQPPNICSLKEMLSISIEKEYKMRYMHGSIEQNNFKQNLQILNYANQQNSNKKHIWINNLNSEDVRVKDSSQKLYIQNKESCVMKSINEFQLCNFPDKNADQTNQNPYYTYFLIACQNVKIRSKNFEQLCKLNNCIHIWQSLLDCKVALHEWQNFISKEMMKQIGME